MTLDSVTCFECPTCKKLSKNDADISACLAKHAKSMAIAKKKKESETEFKKLRGYFSQNLKEARADNVKETLIEAARLLGIKLEITYIAKTSSNYTIDRNYVQFKIAGTFSKIKEYKASAHTKKSWFCGRLLTQKAPLFQDLIRCIEGVEISGGNDYDAAVFDCCILIRLDYIKNLNSARSKLVLEQNKQFDFEAENKRLTSDYLSNRKVAILTADIKYVSIEHEANELRKKIQDLSADLTKINDKLVRRQKELLDHDMPKFVQPAKEFDYDEDKITRLNTALGYDL